MICVAAFVFIVSCYHLVNSGLLVFTQPAHYHFLLTLADLLPVAGQVIIERNITTFTVLSKITIAQREINLIDIERVQRDAHMIVNHKWPLRVHHDVVFLH